MIRLAIALSLAISGAALAEPVSYNIDPSHTYPSFEADHGGMSIWRGKINSSKGTVTLDRAAKKGEVDITMDMTSIDFGHDGMNEHAKKADLLDVAKYPTATYKGTFSKFNGDAPAEVDGQLTLHGVTKPVKLTINKFMCRPHRLTKLENCGGDASGAFNRADFGVDMGKNFGFNMDIKLAIQVEATVPGPAPAAAPAS